MARSKKKRLKARRRLQPHPSATPSTARPAMASSTPRSVPASRVGGDQAMVRSVEMSLGKSNTYLKRQGRMVVESQDPSIPLDRVPYFTHDLIRLTLTALAMVLLLAVGAYLVPRIVQ